jgi:O-methyltransferase
MKPLSQAGTGTIAISESKSAPTHTRNLLVRAIKFALASSSSIVPKSIYTPLYDRLFAVYKTLLRLWYFRHVAQARITRNQALLRRSEIVCRVMPHSLVGSSGLEATFDAASELVKRGIPGAFVECGVAQGGCSALMAMVARTDSLRRTMWLFDSFQGLPLPTAEDYDEGGRSTGTHIQPLAEGACLGTKNQVETLLFEKFALDRKSIFLIEGWFQDTLAAQKAMIGSISLLRIDGDWYESTKCCLQTLYDSIEPGGFVIVDDYGVCFGCKRAVHEFLDDQGLNPQLIPDGRGGILFSKTS